MALQERRRYLRFKHQAHAIVTLKDGTAPSVNVDLVDIGIMGMGVLTQQTVAVGSTVTFELVTKLWGKPIIGEGTVIYVTPMQHYGTGFFRIGVDFLSVDKDAVQSIINQMQADLCAQVRKSPQMPKR
jgi:hypothetical protein